MIAEVHMTDEPQIGIRREGGGIGPVNPQQGGNPYRVVLKEQSVEHSTDPTLDDLRDALTAAYGTDFGAHDPTWISRFTDATRQATSYRASRVLLAGDAAHIQIERHPVAAQVLQNTMAQVALTTPDDRHDALRTVFGELLAMDGPRKTIAAMLTGLDIHYDLGDGHPLLGRRMPDLDLHTTDGPTRVYSLLHEARPVMLTLGEGASIDIAGWHDRLLYVDVTYPGPWELPVLGQIPAPSAVLIRPDGHVAWTGGADDPNLRNTLTTWFGTPAQRENDG